MICVESQQRDLFKAHLVNKQMQSYSQYCADLFYTRAMGSFLYSKYYAQNVGFFFFLYFL